MPAWLATMLTSVGTLILTLSVTLIFNKMVGLPKELKKQKDDEKAKEAQLKKENCARDARIASLEATIATLTSDNANLQRADTSILAVCNDIKNNMTANQKLLDDRLDRLEKREKNAIRAKLLDEYRLFTDETKNPMLAWSEMEHHAFFELVRDYEDLHGNDYVHSTVIPAMNELVVVQMSDKVTLAKLMASRKL